jgi:hypothetical protein
MAFKMRGYSPFTRKTDPPKKKNTTGFEAIIPPKELSPKQLEERVAKYNYLLKHGPKAKIDSVKSRIKKQNEINKMLSNLRNR